MGFEFVKELGQKLSDGTLELPPFPDIAVRVHCAVSSPSITTNRLARIVLSDPVLTARILRMANAAALHRGTTRITDVGSAISKIGFDMVRNAAVTLAMDKSFVLPSGSLLRGRFKRLRLHSVEVGALSYILTKWFCTNLKPDEAMLAGLLHEIGKFYILTQIAVFPELFTNNAMIEELTERWYTGIGRAIVESWGFSEAVSQAVDEHNVLSREHSGMTDLTDVVQVATILSQILDSTCALETNLDDISAFRRMSLDAESSVSVIKKSSVIVRSMSQALSD